METWESMKKRTKNYPFFMLPFSLNSKKKCCCLNKRYRDQISSNSALT